MRDLLDDPFAGRDAELALREMRRRAGPARDATPSWPCAERDAELALREMRRCLDRPL